MKFLKSLFSVGVFMLSTATIYAKDDYVRGDDPAMDALYDMQTGLAGMKEAATNPQLLAQLMQDMQVSL